ncbi:FtsB family cell division protein [Secundilactobacillus kimchicus]|uniref:FtsB family cell division protein n=1 Tax=Secundilactobacillus kimchicus TaxID=528209 RepID=UPI000A43433A|nr:septum formation initiator family protein [Secundilactobacillus kimchicus]
MCGPKWRWATPGRPLPNLKKNLTEAKADNKALTQKVALLNDRDYLDKLIRAKYYYSKSNETIYSLPSDKTTDVSVK